MNIVIIKHCTAYLTACLRRYFGDTRAVAAMEYAIIVGVVVVGVGGAVTLFNEEIEKFIEEATERLTSQTTDLFGSGSSSSPAAPASPPAGP